MKQVFVFLLSIIPFLGFAQEHPYGFTQNFNIPVSNDQLLEMPWVGGANSWYFSEIDLNLDGIDDIVVFEKHGNRLLPFVRNNSASGYLYTFEPQYQHCFPAVHDWLIIKDYNQDGKGDLFSYSLAGMAIYENISEETLAFQLVTETLMSEYYGSDVNLFASPDDFLAIEDVDNDGTLDILNFWVMGQNLHYQKNTGNDNSTIPYIDFHLADECWGKFSEAADGNEITLLSYCENKMGNANEKHVGSSIFLHDFTKNGLKDLVIGDVDYPCLTLLENGGTEEEALMVSQTIDFPNSEDPIFFYSMPAFNLVNIDQDNDKELLASPSDPSLTKSIDQNSVWMYDFNESDTSYSLITKSFWQEQMIDVGSGSSPIFYDWNNDGLLDLFISNYGTYDTAIIENGIPKYSFFSSITYYQNTGHENQPQFTLVTKDFGDLKQHQLLALYPAFGDINGDGTIDLLCGNSKGTLIYFENSSSDETPVFSAPNNNFLNIDVGDYSTPQWFDIDRDGKNDLVIGNRRGIIAAYQNIGTSNQLNLVWQTDTLGGVDVRDFNISYHGFAVPHFFRNGERTTLFCGCEQGYLHVYDLIPASFDQDYAPSTLLVETIEEETFFIKNGIRSTAAVAFLTQDEYPDVVVGNWAGGLSFYTGSEAQTIQIEESENPNINIYPNPAQSNINILIENNIAQSVAIYNLLGKPILQSKKASQNYQFVVEDLPNGLYFITILLQNNNTITRKISISH